jgi:hypothetical protein
MTSRARAGIGQVGGDDGVRKDGKLRSRWGPSTRLGQPAVSGATGAQRP